MTEKHAVTGAFGFSGRYIAHRLLNKGLEVVTLTNSPNRPNPFTGRVKALPLAFDRPEELAESLKGVRVLYNTYWVRFNHQHFSYRQAVDNTRVLFQAAREAGVERVVHVSITNPNPHSRFEYFRGKAELEQSLISSGLSHAILRPAVLFGLEDILINNIVWAIRKLPIIGVFGNGQYRLQPIYVDDLAALAVAEGSERENRIIEAIGPDTFTFLELLQTAGQVVGKMRPILPLPRPVAHLGVRLLGRMVNDVILTKDEIGGLMADLLYVDAPPAGHTRLVDWLRRNAWWVGRRYASEMDRRQNRRKPYIVKQPD